MIEIKGLTVKYSGREGETVALKDINIDINAGDIVVFIGPSGCGKSTLLHVLSGIVKNYEGAVLINGEAVNQKTQRIGLVMQNYGLLPWKTVYENIMLGIKVKGLENIKEGYMEHVLEKLELTPLLKRYPNELSGGQKQRAAIARSFILEPDLLLMDEPFSALDAMTREEAQDLFLSIWKERRVSTIFITHSIEEAVYLGNKIVILAPSPGKIVKVFENPLFGLENLRLNKEYYDFSMELRKYVKGEWSNCK